MLPTAGLLAFDPAAAAQNQKKPTVEFGPGSEVVLPPPFATPSVRNRSQVIGWQAGRTPTAPPGFEVSLFAENLEAPRWTYVLPDGALLVADDEGDKLWRVRYTTK